MEMTCSKVNLVPVYTNPIRVYSTVHTKTEFSVAKKGAFRKLWRNLKTPAWWCSVDDRKGRFSKMLTSNGHVISVTVPYRPLSCACSTIMQDRASVLFFFFSNLS